MGIGRENVFVACALRPVLAVVAVSLENFAERLHAGAEIRLAGVVFEADDLASGFIAREHIIADHTLLGADGVKIERAGKIALLAVPGLVILAQHLISAADGEHRHAVFNGGLQLGGLFTLQIVHQDLLLKVLPAADEEQITVLRGKFHPDGNRDNVRLHPAPFQPPLHTQDVSAVAVEVQNVGI